MLKKVENLFDLLLKTSGRNDKIQILSQHESDEEIKFVLKFLLDSQIVSGISKAKLNKVVNSDTTFVNINNLHGLLDYLILNNTGTDVVIHTVQKFMESNKEYADLIGGIVTKSIKLGVTFKTFEKVFKMDDGVFRIYPMRGQLYSPKYKKKDTQPFSLSQKIDGIRCFLKVENGDVEFYTRNGKKILELVEMQDISNDFPNGFIFDGELLASTPDKLSTAERSALTKSITNSKGVKRGLNLYIYDMIPIVEFKKKKSSLNFKERRKNLEYTFEKAFLLSSLHERSWHKNVFIMELIKQGETDYVVAEQLLSLAIAQGLEGLMLNYENEKYVGNKTTNILKMKKFRSGDGVVIGTYEGDGKYAGKLGGVLITYKNIAIKIGSGFTDEEREMYWSNKDLIIGKVGEYRYFDESKDKNGNIDLQFATWKGIRDDKGVNDVNYE